MAHVIPLAKSIKDGSVKYDAETARAIRLHLERLAAAIERQETNPTYQGLFRRIAKLIRDSKPD